MHIFKSFCKYEINSLLSQFFFLTRAKNNKLNHYMIKKKKSGVGRIDPYRCYSVHDPQTSMSIVKKYNYFKITICLLYIEPQGLNGGGLVRKN